MTIAAFSIQIWNNYIQNFQKFELRHNTTTFLFPLSAAVTPAPLPLRSQIYHFVKHVYNINPYDYCEK